MFVRRVLRDIADRGRDLKKVLTQYIELVKPSFDEFCLPTKKYADVIVPRGAENTVALDLIKQYIQVSNQKLNLNFLIFLFFRIWLQGPRDIPQRRWFPTVGLEDWDEIWLQQIESPVLDTKVVFCFS